MAIDTSLLHGPTSQRLRAEGQARAVLLLLSERGVNVADGERARITGCE